MKIALIGADGQVGSDFSRLIPSQDLIPLTHKDIEIADFASTLRAIKQSLPQVVINTAAFHRTDECEEKDVLAFQVNALGAKNLALACREVGAILVHISTDYVFDGEKGSPYEEADVPNPCTAYGVTKLAGEHYIRYILERHFAIRTSALFGVAGCKAKGGGNFVEDRLKTKDGQEVSMVTDQTVSPTYTLDLARKVLQLLATGDYGIYHIANKGYCTWFEFAQKIFHLAGIKAKLVPITTQQSQARARRPRFSALRNRRLEQQGRNDLKTWEEALVAYLMERGRLSGGKS